MNVWRSPEVLLATSVSAVGLAAVVVAGSFGWPGAPYDCLANPCFCELPAAGLVRQVGNTWSNLGGIVAGLVTALAFARHRHSRLSHGTSNPTLDALGLMAPPALAFQGIGSMFFHGGLTVWGSALDAMSMFAIVGLLVLTQGLRLGWLTLPALRRSWFVLLLGGLAVGTFYPPLVVALVFFLFLSILVAEVLLSRRWRSPHGALFRVGLTVHVSSVAVWFLSLGEGLPLCEPDSVWQGHGVWHLGAAAAVTLMLLHIEENLVRVSKGFLPV